MKTDARRRRWRPTRLAVISIAVCGARVSLGADVHGEVKSVDGKPLANAVVFVHPRADETLSAPSEKPAVMDQIDKQFVPAVLAIQVGSKVIFPNHDQIHHHVYSFSKTKKFEIPLYKGETADPVVFDSVGLVRIGCNIHDWMSAHILVVPTPYFATTDSTGRFRVTGVTTGMHDVAVWHAEAGDRVPELQKEVEIAPNGTEVSFTLETRAVSGREPRRGVRSYE